MNELQIYRGSSPIQTGGIPVKIQVQVGSSVTLAPGLDSLHSCHLQHGGWLEQSTSDPNGDRNAPLIMFYFQDVYSIVYTDVNQSVFVEVFKCSEDTSNDGEPWKGD